jgi:hypothetical protein
MSSVQDTYYSSDEDMDMDLFSPEKSHPPLSPATGAESLFLAGLATSTISAMALAQTLKQNHYTNNRSTVSSGVSVQTDDFATAVESPDDLEDDNSYSAFGKDALVYSRDIIPELEDDSDTETESVTTTENMAKSKKPTTSSKPASTDPEEHADAASHLYEGVKGAWGWGKTLPVVSSFMGISEAIASKVIGIAGTDFEEIDTQLKPHLTKFDNGVLNPAIAAIVRALLGAAGKSDELVKPIIFALMHPMSLIKKDPENKTSAPAKVHETPELTTKPAPAVAVK